MTDSYEALRDLAGEIPPDLAAYFERTRDGSLSARQDLQLNLLPLHEACRWTKDFRDFHSVVSSLRGVVLDDASTSNHHVYLSLPVCAGSVLYLDHDGDSRIVFPNLAAFVSVCQEARTSGKSVPSFHPEAAVLLPDQPALSRLISDPLDDGDDCDGYAAALTLIPSMDLRDFALLRRLASDDDFSIAEAIGNAIRHRPREDLKPIAQACANHPHIQASNAGNRALAAIAAVK